MAINHSVGGSDENWEKMLLIFQAFFEKQKQSPLKNYENNTKLWVQLKNPIENKNLPSSGFLLFQIPPTFNITQITVLHTFNHTGMLHTYVTWFCLKFFVCN